MQAWWGGERSHCWAPKPAAAFMISHSLIDMGPDMITLPSQNGTSTLTLHFTDNHVTPKEPALNLHNTLDTEGW